MLLIKNFDDHKNLAHLLPTIVFDLMQFIQNIILMDNLHMPSDKYETLIY